MLVILTIQFAAMQEHLKQYRKCIKLWQNDYESWREQSIYAKQFCSYFYLGRYQVKSYAGLTRAFAFAIALAAVFSIVAVVGIIAGSTCRHERAAEREVRRRVEASVVEEENARAVAPSRVPEGTPHRKRLT